MPGGAAGLHGAPWLDKERGPVMRLEGRIKAAVVRSAKADDTKVWADCCVEDEGARADVWVQVWPNAMAVRVPLDHLVGCLLSCEVELDAGYIGKDNDPKTGQRIVRSKVKVARSTSVVLRRAPVLDLAPDDTLPGASSLALVGAAR